MAKVPIELQASDISFSELIKVLVQQISELVRVELALIKNGVSEKLRACSAAVLIAVIGIVLALLGLMALLAAGIIALASQVGAVASALIFAVGLLVPGLLLIRRGFRQLGRNAGRWE